MIEGAHEQQPQVIVVARRPAWSGALTRPLAALIPDRAHRGALIAIKTIHTAVFASIAGLLLVFVFDGIMQRPRRRTAIAAGVVLAESAIYASNNQVCPLTPLAVELGARSGSVADIFLPDGLSRRIPLIGGAALIVGLALNARASLAAIPRPSHEDGRG
jgi:hypothetical protein